MSHCKFGAQGRNRDQQQNTYTRGYLPITRTQFHPLLPQTRSRQIDSHAWRSCEVYHDARCQRCNSWGLHAWRTQSTLLYQEGLIIRHVDPHKLKGNHRSGTVIFSMPDSGLFGFPISPSGSSQSHVYVHVGILAANEAAIHVEGPF